MCWNFFLWLWITVHEILNWLKKSNRRLSFNKGTLWCQLIQWLSKNEIEATNENIEWTNRFFPIKFRLTCTIVATVFIFILQESLFRDLDMVIDNEQIENYIFNAIKSINKLLQVNPTHFVYKLVKSLEQLLITASFEPFNPL